MIDERTQAELDRLKEVARRAGFKNTLEMKAFVEGKEDQ